eukprot:SAG11_NODE_1797_length_4246_cov_2.922354_3_plen_208_part_00
MLRLDSFSKTLAPDFRVGWVTGPPALFTAYNSGAYVGSTNGPALSIVALGRMLTSWGSAGFERQVALLQRELQARVRIVLRALRRSGGVDGAQRGDVRLGPREGCARRPAAEAAAAHARVHGRRVPGGPLRGTKGSADGVHPHQCCGGRRCLERGREARWCYAAVIADWCRCGCALMALKNKSLSLGLSTMSCLVTTIMGSSVLLSF